jgi:hypothetical protein
MTEINDNLNPNEPCCDGGDCCSTPSSGGRLKTFLFTAIIVLAVGVGAYSLFLREPEQVAGCGPGSSCGPVSSCVPTSPITSIRASVSLDDQLKGLDCAVLIFLRDGDKLSREQDDAVSSAIAVLKEKEINVEVATVPQSDPQFEAGLERFGISRMPSVVVLSNSGSGVRDFDNISYDAIMDIFNKVHSLPKKVS